MSQSHTKEGDIFALAAEDLPKVGAVLLAACSFGGDLGVRCPRSGDDLPLYVLIYGAMRGQRVTVRPLCAWRSVRLRACSAGVPGDLVYSSSDGTGRIYAGPAPRGTPLREVLVGVAEESFWNGRLVTVRPVRL